MVCLIVCLKECDHNSTFYTWKIKFDEFFIFNNFLIRLDNFVENINTINFINSFMILFIFKSLFFRYDLNNIKVLID